LDLKRELAYCASGRKCTVTPLSQTGFHPVQRQRRRRPGRPGSCGILPRPREVTAVSRKVPALAVMTTARQLWQATEPVHAVLYFAPELTPEATESGLASHGSTYFACRAAPLGQVTAALVTAVFYGFSPTRVQRSVPVMWELVDPTAALQLRTS